MVKSYQTNKCCLLQNRSNYCILYLIFGHNLMCLLINVLMIACNLNLSLWLIPDYAVMLLHHVYS